MFTLHEYNKSSDIYSFGITLWEMIVRKKPYAELNHAYIMHGVSNNSLRPPLDTIPECMMKSLIARFAWFFYTKCENDLMWLQSNKFLVVGVTIICNDQTLPIWFRWCASYWYLSSVQCYVNRWYRRQQRKIRITDFRNIGRGIRRLQLYRRFHQSKGSQWYFAKSYCLSCSSEL